MARHKKLKQNTRYSMLKYHPYRKGTNPNADRNTYRFMDFKDEDCKGHKKSVVYFSENFAKKHGRYFEKDEEIQIVIVPSSTKNKFSAGLRSLVANLQESFNIVFEEKVLLRIKTIPKAHLGGERNEEIHFKSIKCNPELIHDVPIILLDDITTSGSTLNACRKILRKKCGNTIFRVALGRTQ